MTTTTTTTTTTIVLLLCGLPGAGKTTLAQALRQHYETTTTLGRTTSEVIEMDNEVSILEYDRLQAHLLLSSLDINHQEPESEEGGGEEDDDDNNNDDPVLLAWRQSRREALSWLVQQLGRRPLNSITRRLLILDDNFYWRSMRKQIYQICAQQLLLQQQQQQQQQQQPSSSSSATTTTGPDILYFAIIHVDPPGETCVQRNQARSPEQRVPEEVLARMFQRFEPPDPIHHTWEQATLTLRGKEEESPHQQLARILHFIESLPQHYGPVTPVVDPALEEQRLAVERQRTQAQFRHAADLFLRQCVQIVAQGRPRDALAANQARRETLASLQAPPPGQKESPGPPPWQQGCLDTFWENLGQPEDDPHWSEVQARLQLLLTRTDSGR